VDVVFASTQDDSSDGKRASNHIDDVRHGSLIEDMYGVERRATQPYKRIKTEIDQGQSGRKATFTPTGASGLGEWMKNGEEKSDSSIPVTPNVVDLTIGENMTIFYLLNAITY
jgi:hypothetical protein